MAGGRQFRPHRGALFLEHFQDALSAVPFGACEDLLHKTDSFLQVFMQRLAVDFRCHSVVRRIGVSGVDADGRSHAARVDIDLSVQFRIAVVLCVQNAEQCLEHTQIGEELLRQVGDVEHEGQIVDARRVERVGDQRHLHFFSIASCESRLFEAVDERPDLPAQVLPPQHGNLFQILLGIGRFLPGAERSQLIDDLLPLFARKALGEQLHLLPQRLRFLLRKALFWRHHDDGLVGVVQKIVFDQLFKISLAHLFLERREGLAELHVDERRLIVIEPCVEGVQAIDKSLGIVAVVGLSVLEFKMVDARKERSLVKAFVRDLLKRILDRLYKLLFALGIRILGGHRIGGLADAEFKKGIHILAYALVPERFFDRGAFGVAEHVIEDLEGKAQLCVLAVLSQRYIPGQIALTGFVLFREDGIVLADFSRFSKCRLLRDLRIDLESVKS